MLQILVLSLFSFFHPFHVSVTEVHHNAKKNTLEISCRLFYDDFEKALETNYRAQLDILKPTDKAALHKYINDYLNKNLQIVVDGKPATLNYLGFEIDEDAAACYLEVAGAKNIKLVQIQNKLMFDAFPDQTNIMHVTIQDWRQSTKLSNPENKAAFDFKLK